MKIANIGQSIALIELQDLPDAVKINIRDQITQLRQEYHQVINCQVSHILHQVFNRSFKPR